VADRRGRLTGGGQGRNLAAMGRMAEQGARDWQLELWGKSVPGRIPCLCRDLDLTGMFSVSTKGSASTFL
jgi:hypothetical protein